MQLELLHSAVFALLAACWVAYAGVFVFRTIYPTNAQERKRDRTFLKGAGLEAAGIGVTVLGPVSLLNPISPIRDAFELPMAIAGLVIAAASVWLAFSAVRALGRQWGFAARLVEGHRLVTRGPYRFVRHPVYTSLLGMMIATGIVDAHWINLPFGIAIFLTGTMIRIRTEEKLLKEAFGAEFEAYARRVPAIIPGLHWDRRENNATQD